MRYRGGMNTDSRPLTSSEIAAATELLGEAPFAYLAMVEPEGPYVVPLNFAYVTDGSTGAGQGHGGPPAAAGLGGRVYFHTGEGRKTDAIAADPRVSMAVTTDDAFHQGDSPCADGFTFRSLLIWGQARRSDDPEERRAALRAIVSKYDPRAVDVPFEEADFARTLLYEITIERVGYRERPKRP
jgi:nitroimidazol reductase NimA-like FMN-containing flavoprotein (pyridoxamine 5'-phosphate oxidase superfamily)